MRLEPPDLRLDGERDIGQAGRGTTVWRKSGQNPGAALLVHQATRAVDGIDDHAPGGVSRFRRQPFRDYTDWLGKSIEARGEDLLGDAIDRVNRIAVVFAGSGSQLFRLLAFARFDDRAPNRVVKRQDRLRETFAAPGRRPTTPPAPPSPPPPPRPPPPPSPAAGSSPRRFIRRPECSGPRPPPAAPPLSPPVP